MKSILATKSSYFTTALSTVAVVTSLNTSELSAAVQEFTSHPGFSAAAGTLTMVNFDSYTGGQILSGSEYSGQGLSIAHRDNQKLVVFDSNFGFTQFHNQNLNSSPSGLSTGGVPDPTQNVDFNFAGNGVLSAGLWIGNIADADGSNNPVYNDDSNGTLVRFIGASGAVLAEKFLRTDTAGIIQGPATPNNRIFYGLSYASASGADPIKTIRVFEGPGDEDGVVFDDIQFSSVLGGGSTSAPESGATIFTLGFATTLILLISRQLKLSRV